MKFINIDTENVKFTATKFGDFPEKLKEEYLLEEGKFYMISPNGIDCVCFDDIDDLMGFTKFSLALDLMDYELTEFTLFYGVKEPNGSGVTMKPFMFDNIDLSTLNEMVCAYQSKLFKNGFNVNRIKVIG